MESSKEKLLKDIDESLTLFFTKFEELEEKHKQDVKQVNRLNKKQKKYKAEVKELKAQLSNGGSSGDVTEYEKRLDALNQEIQDYKNEVTEYKERLDARNQDIGDYERKLKDKDNQISKLHKKLKNTDDWEEKYLGIRNAFETSSREYGVELKSIENEWKDRFSRMETFFKDSDIENKRLMELNINEAKAELIRNIFDSLLDIKCEFKEGSDVLLDVFKEHGLIEIPTEGVKFDPKRHKASESKADDNFEEGTIICEFNKGYMLEGVVIRKAVVCICKKEDNIDDEIVDGISSNNLEFDEDEVVLGIDLGRNNVMVATYDGKNPKLVPSAEGKTIYGKSFYSHVAFHENGDVILGEAAKDYLSKYPEFGIANIKNRLNEEFDLDMFDEPVSSAFILTKLFEKIKKDAESFLGREVKKAVFSIPLSFNESQFNEISEAARSCGLEPVGILDPVAATLANGFSRENSNQNVLYYDLEGDKVFVSVLSFENEKISMKKAVGDFAADKSINEVIADYLIEEFNNNEGIDLSKNEEALSKIAKDAEKVKIGLSNVLNYTVNLPYIAIDDEGNPLNLNISISRDKLNELVAPIIEKTGDAILLVLNDAGISEDDIDNIVLAGGHSRMPIVREFVSEFIGKPAEDNVDPMEAIAIGAAIKGYNLGHDGVIKINH